MNEKSNQSLSNLKEIIARLEKSETQLKAANQQLEATNQDLIASEKSAISREEKYRLLAENISDVIWVYNINTQSFTYISPSVFQLRGYTVKEAMAQTFTESLILEDAEKINTLFISRLAQLVEGESAVYINELQQLCKDGSIIWVEIVTTPQKCKNGTYEILGVSRNINDRKILEHEQQLTNKQLLTSEQQFKAANQQLSASESTLKISEERYKGIIDHTFNCIAVYKPINNGNDFVIIDFNKSAEKLENIIKENIIGKKVTDIFPGIEKFGLLEVFKRVIKTGKPEHFPISFYKDDNIQGYRENYVFTLSTGELIAVYQDVTNRKKNETKISKLSTAVEQSPSVIAISDLDGNVEYVNPKFTELTGYTKGELLHNNLRILKSGEQSEEEYTKLWNTITSGKAWKGEFHNKKKNGKLFWESASISPIFDKNGKIINYLKVAEDITEQKRNEQIRDILYHISNAVNKTNSVEELIKQIQKELGVIIDTTNFYVALYDHKTDMLSLPYYADEKDNFTYVPASKTLSKYVIKTKKPLLANGKLKKKLVKEGVLEHQGSLSKLWLGVPLSIGGEVTGVFALQSYTDENAFTKADMRMLEFVSEQISISIERKKNEQDLNTAVYNATESDRLKSAFLATISHELRTPLNSIIGFSDLIHKNLEINDILDFSNTIKQSGKHLLNIVSEIFDITLLESGKATLTNQEVNLNSTLNNVYSTIKAEQNILKKDNIDINIIVPPESSTLIVNTDPFKIKQILTNLLKNALKFTNKGYVYYGYVTEVINNKSVVKFFVKDTGIGIHKDKQEYIFGMFKQIDDSYTRSYGGLGIGLSISKKLTELLGGNIWFESKEGVGSTFYFTIPNNPVINTSKQIIKPDKVSLNLSDNTILIVEDDEDSFEFLRIVLSQLDAKIIWAKNGAESISMCQENNNIDLILMDINMQVMNGYIATNKIKEFRPNLPIIAQTALAIAGDREKALDAGCDAYITKPINKEKLLSMVREYLHKG